MNSKEIYWHSIDSLKIYGRYWAPGKDVKGVVCLVHGMGEHCNRYDFVGKFFSDNGIALVAYDQRGHGKSEGKRGHTPSYEHLLQDVDVLIRKAKELFPEKPIILYGHSLGGNIVLNYVMRKKPNLKGVIASSPYLKLAFEPPAFKVKLGQWMKNIYPALSQPTGLDAKAISRIPEEVRKYEEDPLVHDKITAMMFTCTHDAGLRALANPQELDLPLLIFHGTADRLTSYNASKEFAGKVKGDVTFKSFEGAYHETHNDLCRNEVLAMLKEWVVRHFNIPG